MPYPVDQPPSHVTTSVVSSGDRMLTLAINFNLAITRRPPFLLRADVEPIFRLWSPPQASCIMPLPVRPPAYMCARCLVLSTPRRPFSVSSVARIAPKRTQDFNSGFTSSYDPTVDTGRGPMFNKNSFGVPQFYPRDLKKRVDDYVVGQDRAKKTICSTIFNHYQGVRRRRHQDYEERNMREKAQRQRYARDRDFHERRDVHPVQGQRSRHSAFQRYRADEWPQDEFPGHAESVQHLDEGYSSSSGFDGSYLAEEPVTPPQVKVDKSNLLLIGPTGVGKTYILETLSKKLNVPFTIADCNSFTQAGYIGQDVEACIERLLIESNYDIKATEHGIVVLDEFDKLAKRESMNGRDVGGEGVQQALLKLVEGSKVTVNVKDNRSSRSASPITTNYTSSTSTSAPQSTPPQGKVDQYTIDTTNILFVFCGAFVGLDKVVVRRVSKPSMGFGSELRAAQGLGGNKHAIPREMFSHLPHVNPEAPASAYTPLDLTTPVDLQAFGFIPELIGRVHNICALSPLSLDDLYRILTEPRNSLVAQYTALFETYPSRLYFTRKALLAIAERAAKSETGARGLKMEMERVLAEPIFDAPMPYVLITKGCVRGTEKAGYWGKDGRLELERRLEEEDADNGSRAPDVTFEQYREAGQSGA
ncbi:ATP-dependent clp protease ATP-binding subunit clpx [Colletotrichum musicola]|uniref:ATP-dependent clp protease ATP-binding subunit clpx n=1 Tax=Colletotrichum musicola TaxID=2175873 RepID=A0A8H6N685_9PEZI|nr:ATP-dependent clp protease ATP-binding subunit clpx [Colletotrichum musicola]